MTSRACVRGLCESEAGVDRVRHVARKLAKWPENELALCGECICTYDLIRWGGRAYARRNALRSSSALLGPEPLSRAAAVATFPSTTRKLIRAAMPVWMPVTLERKM